MTSEERYALSMRQIAESQAHGAARKGLHAQTSGPSTQMHGRGGGGPEREPPISVNSDEHQLHHEDFGLQSSQTIESLEADPSKRAQAMQNILDGDYSWRAGSQSHQLVGPMIAPVPSQGQTIAPIGVSAPARGQPNKTHETLMIDSLRDHIRTSLMGIPDNLPELKGLQAKMPDAYEGEDDFDHLKRWLHGLIRFMKIHCLTGADKEMDWILIMGTSLKGKAEHWFAQEVEHPNCIIRDWTFESVIIGLYQTFITTLTSQQAMQQYMNIRYSREEGIMAFYHKLLMWAG
jgi:hypothetical protein